MLYAGGMSVRAAARFAGVNHQTVCNWVEAARLLPQSAEGPDYPAAHAAVRRRLILQEREWEAGLSGLLSGAGGASHAGARQRPTFSLAAPHDQRRGTRRRGCELQQLMQIYKICCNSQ